ncbi:MAG: tRNA uridine-5-carboxymethylaminomethyl(34) synthesis GTPase MnmE [Beijerinckiaceae bacterium]
MPDTIYALSSGVGRAGIAVIRISGPSAASIARLMANRELVARKAALVDIRHPVSADPIDRALALWFPGPNSFTGEDVLELHVHGGRAVVAATLDSLATVEGVRVAEPGEFTRRAFANGRLDLSSVEGLADLISADTELQRRQAFNQFSGALGKRAAEWRRKLIDARALIEACLDFPDEAEIPADLTDSIRGDLKELAGSFEAALKGRERAEIIRDGGVVLIAGPPNSGKSTLLNRIAERDVAIISDIPGTTRDLIEITIDIRGLPVTFIDSAGIRETQDPVESEGIARTRARAAQAHAVIWLEAPPDVSNASSIVHPVLVRVASKCDISPAMPGRMSISAKTGAGVLELLDHVCDLIFPNLNRAESSLLSTQRQFDCVQSGLTSVSQASAHMSQQELELAAEELRLASQRLEELTGVISNDALLDEVFGRFCLGK